MLFLSRSLGYLTVNLTEQVTMIMYDSIESNRKVLGNLLLSYDSFAEK